MSDSSPGSDKNSGESGTPGTDEKGTGDSDLEILGIDQHSIGDEMSEMEAVAKSVLTSYAEMLDPAMLDLGWHLLGAKTAAYGKVEQPMINHIRNAVYGLVRLAIIAEKLPDVYPPTETELRQAIACLVVHDYHKFNDIGWDDDRSEFDITVEEIEALVDSLPLDEFLHEVGPDATLSFEDYRAAAVDHHRTDDAMPEASTPEYNDIYPLVRIGDGIASKPGPDEAATGGIQVDLERAFPTAEAPPTIHYHRIDDVKGVVTNLLNGVIADALEEAWDAHVWTIYQDGVVYIRPGEDDQSPLPDQVEPNALYQRLSEKIPESHRRFGRPDDLANDIQFRNAKALFVASGEDYLYNSPETVVRAFIYKALADAPIDEEPTETQTENIRLFDVSEFFERSFDIADRTYGLLKLVNTIRKEVIGAIQQPADDDQMLSDREAVCQVFGVENTTVADKLESLATEDYVLSDPAWTEANKIDTEEYDLTGGGKWDLGYPIAQAYLDEHPELKNPQRPGTEIVEQVVDDILQRLDEMFPEWRERLVDVAAGDTETALTAYIADVTVVDGHTLASTDTGADAVDDLKDTYDEATGYYRRKICSFCTRPVIESLSSFSDIQTSGSVTTFKSGYTRYRTVGSTSEDRGRPACSICQMEFNLRETAAGYRGEPGDDRLFVHLVPDYFYTPFSWAAGQAALEGLSHEAYTRLAGLGEAVFSATTDLGDDQKIDVERYSDAFDSIETNLTVDAEANRGGQPIIESLDAGYDPTAQFGTRALSYYKLNNNDTEFQFFGVFAALGVAMYTGTRAVITDNPIPTITGRDFDTMVRLGTGITKVSSLFGDEITLTNLPVRMQTAAAIVVLGYEIQEHDETIDEKDDSHFAGYIRHIHEKLFPGSYMLKRAARHASESDQAPPVQYVVKQMLPYATALDQLRQDSPSPRVAGGAINAIDEYRHDGAATDLTEPSNPTSLRYDSDSVPVPDIDESTVGTDPPVPAVDSFNTVPPESTPVPTVPDEPPHPPTDLRHGEGTVMEPIPTEDRHTTDDQTDHTDSRQTTMHDYDTTENERAADGDTDYGTNNSGDPDPRTDGGQSTTDASGDTTNRTDLNDVSIPAGGDDADTGTSDVSSGDAQDVIGRLAATAFEIIRPTDNKPHNVERMFRESVEAVTSVHGLSRDDLIYEVTGKLQKFAERIDRESNVRRVAHENSDLEGSLNERLAVYATLFVNDLVYGVYDGEVSLVTKNENELADGFYGATMQCRLASFDTNNEENEENHEDSADDESPT